MITVNLLSHARSYLLLVLCSLPLFAEAQAQPKYEPYTFTTIAGTLRLWFPMGITVDGAGNIYVADTYNQIIRKVTPDGKISTLAGGGYSRPLANNNNDGTGSAAGFRFPQGMAIDSAGNLYVADTELETIRKITSAGVVTTLAGSEFASGYVDGTGSAARFSGPQAVALDHAGNVYVSDLGNKAIRKITPAGVVTTFASSINEPVGIAVDAAGNVYVSAYNSSLDNIIVKITPNGTVSTLAGGAIGDNDGTGTGAGFGSVEGMAVDNTGNVYVADYGALKIRKVTPGGVVTTLAGGNGEFTGPWAVAVDSAGNVYVADDGRFDSEIDRRSTIRKVTPGGVVSTLVSASQSEDGTGSLARFSWVRSVAVDGAGNVYVADASNNTIRKITSAGVVTTLAGSAGDGGSQDGAGAVARFFYPEGVAVDSAGNVYVADTSNYTIRKITPGGMVTTLAGLANAYGYADGTGSAARFSKPFGVAVDTAGNVYVADSYNQIIRKITPDRVVTTLAGSPGNNGYADGTGSAALFDYPFGVAVDSSGNVYVGDQENDAIRKITPGGVVSTLGPRGTFSKPSGVAVDSAGNVYVADSFNDRIAKLTPGGVVSILGGVHYTFGAAGDDGTGIAARFFDPDGIAVDSAGNVYVADTKNEMIRRGVPLLPGQLLNISTRLRVQTGDNVLIGGFKISGNANRQVLLRALGPTLQSFGINDALADPILELHDGSGTLLTTNDNWKDTQQAAITATGNAPPNNLESAILRTLPPGNYTAILRGKNNTAGVALVEAYVVDQAVAARLTNISTRGFVDVNQNVMIGGFISGSDVQVIVRALGPTLSQFNVPNVLADPNLELRDENGTLLAFNDDWEYDSQDAELREVGLAPPNEYESAIIITRPPGNTTAIVRGKNNTTGNALVEVYSLN